MGNYQNLLNTINGAIKTNGTGAITGQLLQTILDGMVASLGAKYQYAGVATPSTNPGTPDENVFYLAAQAGTYTNFGGLVVNDGEVCALKWDGAWAKEITGAATAEQVSQLGQYVENQEWVKVITDADGRILYGVKTDGKFYFGDGCPPQVREYIQSKIDGLSLDEYPDIVSFLGNLIDGDNLSTLLNGKEDKVAGKSLIDKDYADTKSAIESDEWLNVVTDSDGKVLFGIRKETGEPYFPQNETYRVRSSNEWLAVWIDNEGHTLMGIRRDGTVYPNSDDDINTLGGKVNALSNSITEIQALLVSMGVENIDWSAIPAFETAESLEWINAEVDADGKILSGTRTDGSHYIREVDSETIPKYFSDIDDIEGRMEVKTDKNGKILSYRKEDGTKVENYGAEYPSIKVGELDAEFGMVGKHITDKTEIYVERPKFAEMRFYGTLPTDTSDARQSTRMSVKFIVDDNVIFHSLCNMEIQGHGTASFAKHNFSIDFLNANEEELSVKFGDMISIDGYHLKGNMTDRSQARTVGCAAIWREMIRRLDYPYFLVNNLPQQTPENYKADSLYISDAKYSEDGFPFALYVNDEFHGLYTCKLKKNRKNYAMEKSVKTEIFLDSITYTAYLDEVFNHEDWEVKNPKLSGYEEGGEITDAGVLASIERLFSFTTDITTQKENYADYITLPHWLAYVIFCELVDHWDVNGNNTELCSWDGVHWSILPYDMDNTLLDLTSGFKMQGTFFATFRNLFEDELKDMYTMFRKSGMFDVSYLYQFFVNQVDSIPREIYDADYKKWGMENTEDRYLNILFLSKALKARIDYLDSVWLIQN